MSTPRERLHRLLLIIPYVSKHPGVRLEEVAAYFGITPTELTEDLTLLNFVGCPPFGPGDLLEIQVDHGRCHVALDQHFSRPPRLTIAETAALWACAELAKPLARSALDSARRKLEDSLPENARADLALLKRQLAADAPAQHRILEPLAVALREHREVILSYLAAGRATPEEREVRPTALTLRLGHWYLSGFCLRRREMRQFRADRILEVRVTDVDFDPWAQLSAREELPARGATIRFTPRESPRIREQFGAQAHEVANGCVEVRFEGASPEWVVSYVLSFAGEAEVLEPAFRDAVRHSVQERRASL